MGTRREGEGHQTSSIGIGPRSLAGEYSVSPALTVVTGCEGVLVTGLICRRPQPFVDVDRSIRDGTHAPSDHAWQHGLLRSRPKLRSQQQSRHRHRLPQVVEHETRNTAAVEVTLDTRIARRAANTLIRPLFRSRNAQRPPKNARVQFGHTYHGASRPRSLFLSHIAPLPPRSPFHQRRIAPLLQFTNLRDRQNCPPACVGTYIRKQTKSTPRGLSSPLARC